MRRDDKENPSVDSIENSFASIYLPDEDKKLLILPGRAEHVLCGWDSEANRDIDKGVLLASFNDPYIRLSFRMEGEENEREIMRTSKYDVSSDGTLNPVDLAAYTDQLESLTGLDRLDIDGCVAGLLNEIAKKGWCAGDTSDRGKWLGVVVPEGYSISEGAVNKVNVKYENGEVTSRNKQPICHTPLIVTATGKDIDTGDYYLEISFKDGNGDIKKENLTQKDALSKPGAMYLMSRGVNITEKDVPFLNKYVSLCLKENKLEKLIIADKTGWKEDNDLFAFGKTGYRKEGTVRITTRHKEKEFDGLRVTGDLSRWIKAINLLIQKYPLIRFKMYVVMTAPLLRILGVGRIYGQQYQAHDLRRQRQAGRD